MACRNIECPKPSKQLKYGAFTVLLLDIRQKFTPLLRKNPTNIILYIGKNDAITSTSRDILNVILSFKSSINETPL